MKLRYLKKARVICGLLLLLWGCMQCLGATPERWAILGVSGEKSQQVADLVLAGLSAGEVELVERDSLEAISKEQGVMLEGNNPESRVRILGLLKADRLVVVSTRGDGKDTMVLAVVVESEFGARLSAMTVGQEPVAAILRLIKETRGRYKDGVKVVVGVAPLKPNNLERGDDHLSTVYRDLLQGQLSQLPGVAVMEMDEARTIAREITMGDEGVGAKGPVARRVTPVLIDGAYQTAKLTGKVTFNLKVTQGASVLASLEKEVAKAEVPAFFREQVVPLVLHDLGKVEGIPLEAQFQWLVTQAEGFSRLHMNQRAAGLREAALLLKPEEVNERLSLLADYRESFGNLQVLMETNEPSKIFPGEEWVTRAVSMYKTALDHVEHLILNRQIDREVAADLISKHRCRALSAFPFFIAVPGGPPERQGGRILATAVEAELSFHKRVMEVFLTLPVPKPNRGLGLANFELHLYESYLTRIDSFGCTSQQLEACLVYFNEFIAEDMWVSYDFIHFFGARAWAKDSQVSPEQWAAFLGQLAESKKPITRALAEFGRIKFALREVKSFDENTKVLMVERIQRWMEEWVRLPARRSRERKEEPIYREMKEVCDKLVPPVKKVYASRPDPVKPEDWRTNPSTWQYWGTPEMLGHLRFTKLDVTLVVGNAKPAGMGAVGKTGFPEKLSYVQGGQEADYCWNASGVWRLDSKLMFSAMAVDGPVKEVSWDGENLWVLSGKDRNDDRLSVYDGSGQPVARSKEGGLPPHDKRTRMVAVRPGLACVVGTFGSNERTWVAMAKISGKEIALQEIHHAKEVVTVKQPRSQVGNPNLAFLPSWIKVMPMAEGPEMVLVGREYIPSDERYYPLAINPDTLEVSVHRQGLGNSKAECYFAHESGVYTVGYSSVRFYPRADKDFIGPFKTREILEERDFGEAQGFLAHEGKLHAIGYKWCQIDLNTHKVEPVSVGLIPRKLRMQFYGVSKNHGLIGFNGQFYSITMAEEVKTNDG